MATSPSFVSTPRIGRCSLSTPNTATDGTGSITDLLLGAAAGTRVLRVAAQGTASTEAALVNLFLYDGSNWDLFDQITVSTTAGTNVAKAFRGLTAYDYLVLPSATWKLGAALTVAPASGTVRVFAFGGDLT